jgi:hypothetical protein
MFDYKKVHIKQLIKIPKPEFIVLYNGKETYPEKKILRLSDAFMDTEGITPDNNKTSLELEVQIYNINNGKNKEILQRCETLKDYSLFVDKIREYEKTGLMLADSVKSAVKYCVGNNILKKFFRDHAAEVINMMVFDYTFEDIKEVLKEEGIEIGTEKGIEIGEQKYRKHIIELIEQGLSSTEIKQHINTQQTP